MEESPNLLLKVTRRSLSVTIPLICDHDNSNAFCFCLPLLA